MKAPGFLEGILIALIAAIVGEVLFTVLPWFLGSWLALLLIITLLSLSYLLYLLRRSPRKAGRPTLLLLWGLSSLSAGAFEVGIPFYLLLQLGFIWLARSLYFGNGLFVALADLGLHALAAVSALWAFSRSGSLFLAIWSFFLVEAFFSLLPLRPSVPDDECEAHGANPRFEQACRNATAALQKLTVR